MLTGTGEYIIDVKKRMALPKGMRSELGEYVFVAPGFEAGSLSIFPPETLAELQEEIKTTMSRTKAMNIIRRIFPFAQKTPIDGQGRILITQELLDKAGFKTEDKVTVIGMGDYAEIWGSETYNSMIAEDSGDIKAALEEAGM